MTIWDVLPWVVSIIGIVDMYLYAKKVRWVWWMTAANNIIWLVGVSHSHQWGYIPAGVIAVGQAVYGWVQWGNDLGHGADLERDRLWCRALVATLLAEDIASVTTEFNRIRPDGAAALADTKYTITDGFGNRWSRRCPDCGELSMEVVRPGKVQCGRCG